jgi:glycosyltransferase involved in cell wall biosynthesis
MRIAQIAPLSESVPPRCYGGTERIVSYLTEELVREGHEVTLFASGDSVTQATLVAGCEGALRLDPTTRDPLALHVAQLAEVFRRAEDFDILHFHTDYLHFLGLQNLRVAHLTTLHGRLDLPELPPLYRHFREVPLVSISDAQRTPIAWTNWQATVHHGLPTDRFSLHEQAGEYFAFVGRISPEKRLDRAIEIAVRIGRPLRIGAKVDRADQVYFDARIKPLLDHPLVEFLGEIGEDEKQDLIGNARALLFPIDWPEPFGIVMIEAMACGTPVIAFRHGSVPEVIDPGCTGFIVDSIDEAIEAAGRIDTIDRRACRQRFEERFTAPRMAGNYLRVYGRLMDRSLQRTAQGVLDVR